MIFSIDFQHVTTFFFSQDKKKKKERERERERERKKEKETKGFAQQSVWVLIYMKVQRDLMVANLQL